MIPKENLVRLSILAALVAVGALGLDRSVMYGSSVMDGARAPGPADTAQYDVGDEGPAGGIIFFVDSLGEHDFTYLEVARPEWHGEAEPPTVHWIGGFTREIVQNDITTGTSRALGDGPRNTERMLRFVEEFEGVESVPAAELAADYSVTRNDQTFDDWFLPSDFETLEICGNLQEDGLVDFAAYQEEHDIRGYWTSSEDDVQLALVRNFGGTCDRWSQSAMNKGLDGYSVLPVRAF